MIKKKIIYGCDVRNDADKPYLTRYTIIETKRGNLCLHIFHRSDHASEMHDHPWNFWTLILWRGYMEQFMVGDVMHQRRVWPGQILYRPATHRHRADMIGGKKAVTLVWRGPYVRDWGFYMADGFKRWQDYFKEFGC